MEIKFKNPNLKIALKDESNNLIGDLYMNPDNAIQRSKILDLYQTILKEEEKIKKIENKIETESSEFIKNSEIIKLEKDIFELLFNGLVGIYGDIIQKLANATGNDINAFITLINGLSPYYQDATNKNIDKYIKSEK